MPKLFGDSTSLETTIDWERLHHPMCFNGQMYCWSDVSLELLRHKSIMGGELESVPGSANHVYWKHAVSSQAVGSQPASVLAIDENGILNRFDLPNFNKTKLGEGFNDVYMAAAVNGKLYTIDIGGNMSCIDISNGQRTAIGTLDGLQDPSSSPNEWTYNDHLLSHNGFLYCIGKNGSLRQIDPANGQAKQVGEDKAMAITRGACIVAETNKLYTVNNLGVFAVTDLNTFVTKQICKDSRIVHPPLMWPVSSECIVVGYYTTLYKVNVSKS